MKRVTDSPVPDLLLATKLAIPPLPNGLIERPRLLIRLDECLHNRLCLISAPAGYGKTSLVRGWLDRLDGVSVGWLSLDAHDDDPARFMRYLLKGFEIAAPGTSTPTSGLAFAPRPGGTSAPPYLAQLNALVNLLTQVTEPVVFVLEDYHHIHADPVHRAVTYLLDHQPPGLHLLITTRAEPPLPIARLRGRGQLVEVRAGDLRFTEQEAAEFLSRNLPDSLDRAAVQALVVRTEGWAVGSHLTSLLLANREDTGALVHEITGSTRFIMDYLIEEVLLQQPPADQQFLLHTSILDRLCGELCDEILAEVLQPGSEAGSLPASHFLDHLERDNLFITSLDGHGEWYRYHRLFADILRKRLAQTSPESLPALHRRASLWYQRHGLLAEAVAHSLQAGDHDLAARQVNQAAGPALMHSEATLLLGWIGQLSVAALQSRPRLRAHQALAMLLDSQPLEEIETLLMQVEAGKNGEEVAGETAALRALLAMLKGDIPTSIRHSQAALARLADGQALFRSLAADNLGMCQVLSGDLAAASQAFEQVADTAGQTGNQMMAVAALSNLAGLQMVMGRLRQAQRRYHQILSLATDPDGRWLPVAGKALMGLGELAREMNDLDAAGSYLEEAVELLNQHVEIGKVMAWLSLARLRHAQGRPEAAWELLDTAAKLARKLRGVQMDDRLVEAARARLQLIEGQRAPVEAWAAEHGLFEVPLQQIHASAAAPGYDIAEPEFLILARLLLARGQAQEAREILEALAAVDERKGRRRRLLEVRCLLALALQELGQPAAALQALGQALADGGPEGYVRTFIDEGFPMQRLLGRAVQQGVEADLRRATIGGHAGAIAHPCSPRACPSERPGRAAQRSRAGSAGLHRARAFQRAGSVAACDQPEHRKEPHRQHLQQAGGQQPDSSCCQGQRTGAAGLKASPAISD